MSAYREDEDTPANDLDARREPLERAAALRVGMIVFAFSRLDMHLALGLAWAAEESPGDRNPAPGLDFHQKLGRLQAVVDAMEAAERRGAFQGWIDQCRALEVLRNEFIHGRWLPDTRTGKVVSFTEEADGSTGEVSYSLGELDAIASQLDALRAALLELRRPVAVAS